MAPQVCWQVARQRRSTKKGGRIQPLDLKTTPAAKPATKPIVTPSPYEGQDLDINGRNGLDVLDRLDELQRASA